MEEKVNRIYSLVIVLIILVAINLIFTFIGKGSAKDTTSNGSNTSTTNTTSNYDVSKFKQLTTAEVVKLFDDTKNTYVVYIGRESCSACVSFVPTLQKMQDKYNYVTQYLDFITVDTTSDDFAKLMKKLDTEVTLNVNGETKTQSYGDFFGYTPMTFIIKKGKFVDGIVGAYSESKFESFLNKNGIK